MILRLSGWLSVVIAASFVAACAGVPTESGTVEEQVLERAQARWDAMLAGDFEKGYEFTAPSYRALTELRLFKAQYAGSATLISAKAIGVKCTDLNCDVRTRIEYKLPLSRFKDVIVNHYDERWVKEDEKWWVHLR